MMKLLIAALLSLNMTHAASKKAAKEKPMATTETATLAGGCFWGMEELLRSQPGVKDVEVGYTGGDTSAVSYDLVKTGTTGQAESVQIKFDPAQTSYEKILEFFFKIHDPTTENRQGNDIGTQYRSTIFYHDEKQKQTAEGMKLRVEKSGAWKKPIVTQITPFKSWARAEDFHQDYLQKNPAGYTCHFVRKVNF